MPKLLGSQKAAEQTLRVTWHLVSLMWMAVAIFLLGLAIGTDNPLRLFYVIMTITFAIQTAIPLILGKGRHKSWIGFGLITVCFGILGY